MRLDCHGFPQQAQRDGRHEVVSSVSVSCLPRWPWLRYPGVDGVCYVLRRMMSDWKVDLVNDNISELNVEFKGPPDSKYQAIQYLLQAPKQQNNYDCNL